MDKILRAKLKQERRDTLALVRKLSAEYGADLKQAGNHGGARQIHALSRALVMQLKAMHSLE